MLAAQTATTPVADAAPAAAAAPASDHTASHPRIKSFVKRGGRTTTAQARARAELGARYLLPYASQPLQPEPVFGRRAPLILEIGFGMGEASAHIARLRPGDDFLCCEVHAPGVGALLKRIDEQGLGNVRIVAHDAVEVLQHMLPEGTLAGAHIFFPDPWHKLRHHKRRLLQPPLVALLASRLQPGAYLHCATDWQPYAEQMLQVLGAEPLLANATSDPAQGGYAPKPDYRPLTKFEQRGLRLGHGVWDLVFVRR